MKIRTSLTDPLHIDSFEIANGVIGMTFCPGKHGNSYDGGRWERDLYTDLKVIVNWGASTLVTLMEEHELQLLKVEDLGPAASELGLDWHLLQIQDGCAPEQAFEDQWQQTGKGLRQRLQAGEYIVLHCRGGLGRTGTIAARLAVEFGMPPNEAIRVVRGARPGTIETNMQVDYVLRQKPVL